MGPTGLNNNENILCVSVTNRIARPVSLCCERTLHPYVRVRVHGGNYYEIKNKSEA